MSKEVGFLVVVICTGMGKGRDDPDLLVSRSDTNTPRERKNYEETDYGS
jgi:hypothetical protein